MAPFVIPPGGGRWTDTGNSSGGFTTTLAASGGVVAWSLVGAGLTDQSGESLYSGSSVSLGNFLSFDFTAVLRQAFDTWAAVANIEFIQVQDGGGNWGVGSSPTIRIAGGYTDGPGNNLAWAFYPANDTQSGDILFDSGDTVWTAANFLHVAMHEIGHALGLDHQPFPTPAIMNPSVDINFPMSGLQADDINGIRALYGAQDFGANVYYMPAGQTNLTLLDTPSSFTVVGNGLANVIRGSSAGESFRGSGGNDTVDGGGGADSAIFSGQRSAYTITGLTGNGVRLSGPDGIDTLDNVEWLVFGDQTVQWLTIAPPADVFFADPGTPGQIAVGGFIYSNVDHVGDRDWFRVTLTADVTYTIQLDATTLGNPYLRLYDSNGTVVAENNDSAGTANSRLDITAGYTGTYYIAAAGYADAYDGGYYLAVNAFNGTLTSERADRPDGTFLVSYYDGADSYAWGVVGEDCNASAQRTIQRSLNDDAQRHDQFWDVNNSFSWSTLVDDWNTSGQRIGQRVFADNGSFQVQHWDPMNDFGWSSVVDYWDAQSRRTRQSVDNDSGSAHNQYFDVNNSFNWAYVVDYYDASDFRYQQVIAYDNGTSATLVF